MVKMAKKILFLFIVVLLFFGKMAASQNIFEKVNLDSKGAILCIDGIDGTDTLYAGTESGLFKTNDSGREWKSVEIPSGSLNIGSISATKERLTIVNNGKILTKNNGSNWEAIEGLTDILGIVNFSNGDGEKTILAWSKNELFKIKKENISKITPLGLDGAIEGVSVSGGGIFLAGLGTIYKSNDEGKSWVSIFLTGKSLDREGLYDPDETSVVNIDDDSQDDSLGGGIIKNIDPYNIEDIVVSTIDGVFLIKNGGESGEAQVSKIGTMGLPRTDLVYAAHAGGRLFAATENDLFVYSEEGEYWETLAENTFHEPISILKGHIDSKGHNWLWSVGGENIYKQVIGFFPDNFDYQEGQNFYLSEAEEPSILETQKMAIEYAEVSSEKIKKWRQGASWKAIMPKVSFGFSESTDDNSEIYTSSTTSYIVTAPRAVDNDWGVDVTWDLSELIWSPNQTSIDVRSKLMVQLRNDILEEVTRIYFERRRLIQKLSRLGPDEASSSTIDKHIRLEELTAYLDALTGSRFSRVLRGTVSHKNP